MIKGYLRKIRYILSEIPYIVKANKINARYMDIPAKKNRVNIFQYHPARFGYTLVQNSPFNLGDSLGEVIIKFLLEQKGIDINAPTSRTRHFYCVGTNIHGAYQDATIWGSGIYPPHSHAQKRSFKKLGYSRSKRTIDKKAIGEIWA